MPQSQVRLIVFRLILAIAIAISVLVLHLVTEPVKRRAKDRYEQCLRVADRHARNATGY